MSKALYIEYGTTRIPFQLQYSQRKTLGIAVSPDRTVMVTAPANAGKQSIIKNLTQKAGWIYRQLRRFESMLQLTDTVTKKEYVSGETILYLGRKYRLKIIEAAEESVQRKGLYLQVYTRQKRNTKKIETLVSNWYRQQAHTVFRERMNRFDYLLQREKISVQNIIVRRLEKRWGSCTARRNIVLNTALVQAPVQCIDYVIVHELCHLKHFHHGKPFYVLLDKYMPDWMKRKERLQSIYV